MTSVVAEHTDIRPSGSASVASRGSRFKGNRAAMVTFSPFPYDPRPRRALETLVKEGMHVDLICLRDGDAAIRERLDGIDILRVPLRHRRGSKAAYAYEYTLFILISSIFFGWRALLRRYDLVYVHNMPDVLILSALIPKALGAKVVLDLHDPMPELMTTIYKLDKDSFGVRVIGEIEKWSIARANSIVTPNLAFKRIFGSRSCSPEKIEVVMNSPDGEIFPFRGARKSLPEGRSEPFVIMYHGSLVERNGLDLAVEALVEVRETVPGAELRIYGASTPFLEQVMKVALNKGLQNAVRYLGPRKLEDLVAEVEKCDVGVVPNHRNLFTEINMPTRIFEYLSLGKPVIAPRTPGIQDYFSNDSLLFFTAGDANDLARAIKYVFHHPAEVNEIVNRGQEVYQRHVWDKERMKLLGVVDRLVGNKRTNWVPL